MLTEQEIIRREKLNQIRETLNPYPERFPLSHSLKEAGNLADGTEAVSIAGRLLSIRRMGKLTFGVLGDIEGRVQIALKKDVLGEEVYQFVKKQLDLGDFVGVTGEIFTTQAGEKTVRADQFTFLGKALKPLPEKFHGLNDKDSCYRKRYLDLIMNQKTRDRFLLKSSFVKAVRRFLEEEAYIEIETPVLINKPSGALAKPFTSHHNALDMEVYLRIAPETYLKRAVVGGFNKVFEFARCFRNEGIDPTHLQDFTMLECYLAYANYQDNMKFTQRLLAQAVYEVFGSKTIDVNGQTISFEGEWPVVTFKELIERDCGIDIDKFQSAEELLKEIIRQNIKLETSGELQNLGRGNLIDQLYKKVSRPRLTGPVFLVEHPIDLSPLARAKDDNAEITDRFQLIVNGAEVINGYSELVDPMEQYKRLQQQAASHGKGDEEAMVMDKDYITAMEYGMPPISGWGMGVDRILQVLTGEENLKDLILFPLMRPVEDEGEFTE
ncbi:lysine--tRNA ligase [Anaerocolumna sp. AGMB13020]|uniref:lysine--tRNA ligase n=1 Tax=Anaerocolumna sp. AGMB13020 TaxID=3081750 RepID=UPI002953460C|nr:lysine--tRNA ligase [Anaerocolumna sp. AGMB13020]WOO35086.1 lysine--tRNA ligase [Anaerocolumna sp. AGMB13020]